MAGAVVAVCTAIVVVGCDSAAPEAVHSPAAAPSPAAATLAARGQVVSSTDPLTAWSSYLPSETRATRIVYRSVSGVDGAATTVSGAVFVPGGDRPAGGWPLIAYAHGTTGVTRDCGPSDRADMFGDIRAVAGFLNSGYAVVTTDYQGLGERTSGPAHPYLEPRTAGYNVIDATRAARSVEPTIGPEWVAVGASQGGAAAWASAEEFAGYGPGAGQLVGAAATVPLLDAGYLVDRAQSGELTPSQRWLYPILVKGVAQANPQLTAGDYLHGVVGQNVDALVSCSGERSGLTDEVNAADGDAFMADAADADRLRGVLDSMSLPRTRTDVPILAMYGSVDEIIPVDVMEVTLGRACTLGDTVTRVRREGQGHSLDPGALLGQWIAARFAGQPATGDC